MQTDRDALLAGILADPDADLPRLVFADWLEETGHPANCARAEYIRLAIDETRHPAERGTRRKRKSRLDGLKAMFDDEWDVFHKATPGRGLFHATRSRGFVDHVSIRPAKLATVFPELPERYPIREMLITGGALIHTPVGPLPPLPWLEKLVMFVEGGGGMPVELLRRASVPRLRAAHFRQCDVTDEDVIRLVHVVRENPTLGNLEILDLHMSPLTDHAAHTLAAAYWPPPFRSLNIDGTRMTNAGREVLFRRFGFEELRPRLALS